MGFNKTLLNVRALKVNVKQLYVTLGGGRGGSANTLTAVHRTP